MFYSVLQSTTPYYKILLPTTRYYSVLQGTTEYKVLKYYSIPPSTSPCYNLQLCTSKYDSVLQTTRPYYTVLLRTTRHYKELLHTAKYYSVLQSITKYYQQESPSNITFFQHHLWRFLSTTVLFHDTLLLILPGFQYHGSFLSNATLFFRPPFFVHVSSKCVFSMQLRGAV